MSPSRSSLVVLVFALGCAGVERAPEAATPQATACPSSSAAPEPPAQPAVAVATPVATPLAQAIRVGLKNPLGVARAAETVRIRLAEAQQLLPVLQAAQAVVQTASGAAVLSQLVDSDGDNKPDELVFQSDLGPNEERTFLLGVGTRSAPSREQFKAYGRFVRERHDDFAWENDRTAHRMYGPALETWAADPLTSSGIDVWVKRTPRLVINDWYQSDDYHRDNGDGGDFYSVGPSRGCGGIGIWDGKALHVSRNFTSSRVLANGPIRLIFELSYAPWDAGGGVKVAETKRVIVDAGQHFDRFESTFKITGKPRALALALGIAKHSGAVFETDAARGVLRSWEPFAGDSGHAGCAVISVSAQVSGFAETTSDRLLLTALADGTPASYLAGTGWDKGGHVADSAAWSALVNQAQNAAQSPIVVALAAQAAGAR